MDSLNDLVRRAQAGDVEAYGRLVQATQTMAYAVALGVVREPALAQDAAQEAYLRAFRRLRRVAGAGRVRQLAAADRDHRRVEHAAGPAIHAAAVRRRAGRSRCSTKRKRPGPSCSAIGSRPRCLRSRPRNGGCAIAGITDAGAPRGSPSTRASTRPSMRKRLQRIRDKLRKEMEVAEQRAFVPKTSGPTSPPRSSSCWRVHSSPTCRRTRSARSWICCAACTRTSTASSCRRSSISPKRSRRSATSRSTSIRRSCTAWTIGASCGTTSRCRCC